MNILVIGSGAREHALVWKLSQSRISGIISCAPGNAGTDSIAHNIPIKANDLEGLLAFAKEHQIGLTVVGPEQPLIDGIVDLFEEHQLPIFGPSKAAARLEGSKVFAKQFMQKYKIPTAEYRSFNIVEFDQAVHFIDGNVDSRINIGLPLFLGAQYRTVTVAHGKLRDKAFAAFVQMFVGQLDMDIANLGKVFVEFVDLLLDIVLQVLVHGFLLLLNYLGSGWLGNPGKYCGLRQFIFEL